MYPPGIENLKFIIVSLFSLELLHTVDYYEKEFPAHCKTVPNNYICMLQNGQPSVRNNTVRDIINTKKAPTAFQQSESD